MLELLPSPVLMVSVGLAFVTLSLHLLLGPFSEEERISLIHVRACEPLLLVFLEHLGMFD